MEDELVSIEAIYGPGTLVQSGSDTHIAILTIPARPSISIRIKFPLDYPEECPRILGPESTGQDVAKGDGKNLAQLMATVLQDIFRIGEPCVFELVEECTARLADEPVEEVVPIANDLIVQDSKESESRRHAVVDHGLNGSLRGSEVTPDWTLSEVITEKKSVFIARVAPVTSPSEAKQYLAHLLATDKKVAKATHNITAWRIKGDNGVQYQDCDDDGETAAGGRLLHLLELMNAWNVMVVVTRWYGGVHLGPDRFRLINQAARDALVVAGIADQGEKRKGKK